MKNTLVKLTWTEEGYKPENYSWSNYRVSYSRVLLQHDLYHHQPNESGKLEEELRAYGGAFYFDNYSFREISITMMTILAPLRYEAELFDHNVGLGIIPIPKATKKIETFIKNEINFRYPYYVMDKVMQGWDYSKQYSRKGYHKFSKIQFKNLWKEKVNLQIDVDTGKYIKL